MKQRMAVTPPIQLPLIPLDEEQVRRKARELFDSSRVLSARWASFDKVMADPLMGRCLRLSATALLRRADRARGRRR